MARRLAKIALEYEQLEYTRFLGSLDQPGNSIQESRTARTDAALAELHVAMEALDVSGQAMLSFEGTTSRYALESIADIAQKIWAMIRKFIAACIAAVKGTIRWLARTRQDRTLTAEIMREYDVLTTTMEKASDLKCLTELNSVIKADRLAEHFIDKLSFEAQRILVGDRYNDKMKDLASFLHLSESSDVLLEAAKHFNKLVSANDFTAGMAEWKQFFDKFKPIQEKVSPILADLYMTATETWTKMDALSKDIDAHGINRIIGFTSSTWELFRLFQTSTNFDKYVTYLQEAEKSLELSEKALAARGQHQSDQVYDSEELQNFRDILEMFQDLVKSYLIALRKLPDYTDSLLDILRGAKRLMIETCQRTRRAYSGDKALVEELTEYIARLKEH